jgi:hypothetical protein
MYGMKQRRLFVPKIANFLFDYSSDIYRSSHVQGTTLLYRHLLTYSMEQSPSWKANWIAASQEIPRVLWNPKVPHRTHKPRHVSLSWASPIQSPHPHPTSWRSILTLSSHLSLGLPRDTQENICPALDRIVIVPRGESGFKYSLRWKDVYHSITFFKRQSISYS